MKTIIAILLFLPLILYIFTLQPVSQMNSMEIQGIDKIDKNFMIDDRDHIDVRSKLDGIPSILKNNSIINEKMPNRARTDSEQIVDYNFYSENSFNAKPNFSYYSNVREKLSSSTRQNNFPVIYNLRITPFYPLTGDNLNVTWSFLDNSTEQENIILLIQWFRYNGTLVTGTNDLRFDLLPNLTNLTTVTANNTKENEKWFAKISLFDDNNSSVEYLSNTITIHSVQLNYINSQYEQFLLDSEDIKISFNYSSPFLEYIKEKSFIYWYKNGVYQPDYDNQTLISSDQTQISDNWYFIIIPYNGEGLAAPIVSESRTIESKPVIHDYGVEALTDIEGHYILWVNTSDPRNEIKFVIFALNLNETETTNLPARFNGSYWIFNFYLHEFDLNYSLLNTISQVELEISTIVKYNDITSLITTYQSFNFSLMDFVPPRVVNVVITYNNLEQPTKITFTAEVEEYGSNITEVLLFYDFIPVSNINRMNVGSIVTSGYNFFKITQSSGQPINFESVKMNPINTTYYSVTLDFQPKSDTFIQFQIQITDQTGNINLNAFPEGLNVNRVGGIWTSPTGIRAEGIFIFLIILTVSIFFFLGLNYLRLQNFKKKEAIQQIQRKINDIKSISMIFGRHIDSGLIFYNEKIVPSIQADIDKFSTLSSALSIYMQEVSKQLTIHSAILDENKTEFEVLTRKGLYMLIWNGKYSSFVIVSNRAISKDFYDILAHIGKKVEQSFPKKFKNNHHLVQFPANLVKKIVREYLPLYYNTPLLLNEAVLREKNIQLSQKESKMLCMIKQQVLIGKSLNYIFSDVIIDRLSQNFKFDEIVKFIQKGVSLNLFVESSPNLIEVFPDILAQKNNMYHLVPQWSHDVDTHWETMNFPNLTKPNKK